MDKHEKRLLDITNADRSEWQRTVMENDELLAELSSLRARYGFPLSNPSQVYQWLDTEKPEIRARFGQELDELIQNHKIHERWRNPLFYLVTLGWPLGLAFSLGFPSHTSDGKIVVHSDTDLSNPIVQDDIKRSRRRWLLKHDPPPRPQPMKDGDPRKLDWTPVVEWRKRYTYISEEELAQILGYDRSYLSRKLSEFDVDRDK